MRLLLLIDRKLCFNHEFTQAHRVLQDTSTWFRLHMYEPLVNISLEAPSLQSDQNTYFQYSHEQIIINYVSTSCFARQNYRVSHSSLLGWLIRAQGDFSSASVMGPTGAGKSTVSTNCGTIRWKIFIIRIQYSVRRLCFRSKWRDRWPWFAIIHIEYSIR
jgi:hypothetical protein